MESERAPGGVRSLAGNKIFSAGTVLVLAFLVVLPWFSLISLGRGSEGGGLGPALRDVWGRGETWVLLGETVLVAGAVTVLAVIAGTLEALLYFRSRFRWRIPLFFLSLFPLFVPPVLLAVGAVRFLESGTGAAVWKGALFSFLEVVLTGYSGMIVVMWLSLRPLVTICVGARLRTVPGEYEDCALLDASAPAVALRLSVRLAAPGILLGALLVFLRCLLESAVPAVFGFRAYAFETFAMLSAFYDDASAVAFATPLAAAGIMVGTGAVLTFQALETRGLSFVRSPDLLRPGGSRRLLILLAVLFAAPFWILGLWGLLHPVRLAGALARNWPNIQDELARTAVDSSAAAFLALLAGFCLAAVACCGVWGARSGVKALFSLPLFLPPVLFGVALVAFWNQPGWRGAVASTPVLLVIAKALLVLPVVTWPMVAVLSGLDRALFESFSLAGARWRHHLRHLFLPAVQPHLPLLGLAAFLLAAAEFEVSTLLSPPGWTPFSVRLFSLLHYGVDDLVAGLALVGFSLAVVLALAATWLAQREFLVRGRKRRPR